MKKEKSQKNYVVGYSGKEQVAIYSRIAWAFPVVGKNRKEGGIEKMTFFQAQKHLKEFNSPKSIVAIYKLVPVKKIKNL